MQAFTIKTKRIKTNWWHILVWKIFIEADITSQAVGLSSSVDFSLMSLFLRADIVVKSVIILLIAASIYSWAIIIEKFKTLK